MTNRPGGLAVSGHGKITQYRWERMDALKWAGIEDPGAN